MSASLSLAKAGHDVTLLEARKQLGGRIGSFPDNVSGSLVDYCQHVGMACCTHLVHFLEQTNATSLWDKQASLHFFSKSGDHFQIRASSLPAPFHLSSLVWKWPDLSLSERISTSYALWRIMRLGRNEREQDGLAIEWLRKNRQSDAVIAKFWATILVSALGEKIDRVNLKMAHKVLIEALPVIETLTSFWSPNSLLLKSSAMPLFHPFGSWAFKFMKKQ